MVTARKSLVAEKQLLAAPQLSEADVIKTKLFSFICEKRAYFYKTSPFVLSVFNG